MATACEAIPTDVLLNPIVKNLCAMAARTWKNRWIVTFSGATGIGKSAAVKYADRTLPFPHRVIECKQITTRYTVLEALGLDPGQAWKRHGHNWKPSSSLYLQATERAQLSPYLLIFDEADRLRMDCFEMLRDLWDDARLPMLLVGNRELDAKIDRQHPRLLRRIYSRHTQRPLNGAGLRDVLGVMGWKLGDAEFDLVWKLVGGSPGFAEAVLRNAQEIADSHGVKLNEAALAAAARHFPTLREAV